jgi:hypothetical protein
VVIAASDDPEAVGRTLASLGRCRGVEVVVAARFDPVGESERVIWVTADEGADVPRLRRLGLDRARGDIVVFTEDSCRCSDGWLRAWRDAFLDPALVAATGPIEPAMGDRAVDWAVFFFEYAPFLAGAIREVARLAGNNFAIHRELADRLDPDAIEECDIPGAAWAHGGKVGVAVGAVAGHTRSYGLTDAIRDRFRLGLSFGRHRATRLPMPFRLAGIAAGPGIALVQAVRLTTTVVRNRRYVGRFVRSAPVTILLLTAWSVGEWLGWSGEALGSMAFRRRHGREGRSGGPPTVPAG